MVKLTTEEFINRAKKVHGDMYDYSNLVYRGWEYKVTIRCKEHGEFMQRGGDHLVGKGCMYCSGRANYRSDKHLTENKDGSVNIELSNGDLTVVDKEDVYEISKYFWSSAGGYAYNAKLGKLHRVLMGVTNNKIFVDHKDGDPLNNRKNNLRVATSQQNQFNQRPAKNSVSKYKGVFLIRKTGKWFAQIKKDYKAIHLGCFETEEEAARAYDKKAKELFGEFAYLNFPDEHK